MICYTPAKVDFSNNLEKFMSDYNHQDRPASVLAFAQALTATPGIPLVSTAKFTHSDT